MTEITNVRWPRLPREKKYVGWVVAVLLLLALAGGAVGFALAIWL